MQINNSLTKMWKIFLGLLFPIHSDQDFLNKLTAEKFLSLAKPACPPLTPNTLSLFNYKDKIVKKAIWSLKFKNNQAIAKLFAEVIYDNLVEELSNLKLTANFDRPLLIVIPLSRQRYKDRGYNQVDLIAQAIAKLDRGIFLDYKKNVLKKIKNTQAQSGIKNKENRLKNVRGCFKITDPKIIQNQNIILLDDVTTTGATLTEAVSTLKTAQPKKILCVTFAH